MNRSRIITRLQRQTCRWLSGGTNAFGSQLPSALGDSTSADGSGNWERAWQEKVTPWDTARPAPAISHLISLQPELLVRSSNVLVPGCGSGHDARALAAAVEVAPVAGETPIQGKVLGLDLSQTAIDTAQRLQKEKASGKRLLESGLLSFKSGDFFAHHRESGAAGGYDLIWDYTFYCALPPVMRQDWAHAMAGLVRPGTGKLATLLFPVGEFEGGPPFAVDVDAAKNELELAGFSCSYLEPVPAEHSLKPRAGREWLGLWSLTGTP